jgi:LuxR family maltose regulon positive regulatory protein
LAELHASPRSSTLAGIGAEPAGKYLQFLTTKLIPPPCSGLIERPRLIDTLSRVANARLALIKASAGFGKTSLAAAFAERLRLGGEAVAWLTLDAEDDETSRFLFGLSQALQRATATIGAAAIDLIKESLIVGPHAIISALINDLADVDDEVYLFLDDFHCVSNAKIYEALAFLLKNAPANFHVVLSSRTEPLLPLASLRVHNHLLELDATDLRFDLAETQSLIAQAHPGTLTAADVKILHSKTEGWPAALRIVASTSIEPRDFGQYVRNLSGAQRSIGAYLAEMLDSLPGELVVFMVRTAILDGLSASLCDAVIGAGSSQELLGLIERRQLLLAPLDYEGRWYRYHPLLAEYLNTKLASELRDEIPALHQRASLWYAGQELWTEAVKHAIAAGQVNQALSWMQNCAMALVKRGDLFTLLGWQRQFPIELMRGQPEARLAIAWGLALAMRFDESLDLLNEIERDVGAAQPALHCECQTIRSVVIGLKDDSETAMSLAQGYVAQSNDPWTANVASNVIRLGHLKAGNFAQFHATPWIPYSSEDDKRNVFASVYRRCFQGMVDQQQLRLSSASRFYTDALKLAEQHAGINSVAAVLPACLIAGLRYEQGLSDEAEGMLIDREGLIGAGAMLDCVLSAYLVLVRVAAQRANFERAYTLLERAENLAAARGWGRLAAAAILERMRLNLREDSDSEAAACLVRLRQLVGEYPIAAPCAWSDIGRCAKLADAYLASKDGRFDAAIFLLTELEGDAEQVRNTYFAVRVAICLSLTRFRANQPVEALRGFQKVLERSAQAGICRTILDEGADVGPLLLAFQEDAERSPSSRGLLPYVGKLIEGWRIGYGSDAQRSAATETAGLLSSRERDTLTLIAEGLSNKEIARSLSITPETVKSHVKHIFTKLRVERRAQAVARAQSLGIVGTH